VRLARLRRRSLPYLFVAPAIALLMAVNFYPMLFSLQLSLSVWPPERLLEGPTLVGLQNLEKMLGDARLWSAARFTITYSVLAVSLELVLGVATGVLLDARLRGRTALRSAVVLPIAMAPIVVGVLWTYLLNSDYGLLNYLLGLVGLGPVPWRSTQPWATVSIVLADLWQHTPFVAIIVLAGLQSIPDHYAEAARIDGASARQVFFAITLPLLRPVLLVAAVLRTTNAVRMFDLSYSITGGGPIQSTETFSFLAYSQAFLAFDMPYAAAISWLVFALNLAITLVLVRLLLVKVQA
jgi:multiple sugar transport system permease protein